jgi:hypothetical protein
MSTAGYIDLTLVLETAFSTSTGVVVLPDLHSDAERRAHS